MKKKFKVESVFKTDKPKLQQFWHNFIRGGWWIIFLMGILVILGSWYFGRDCMSSCAGCYT